MDADLLVALVYVGGTAAAALLLRQAFPATFAVTRLRLPGMFLWAYLAFILVGVAPIYRRFDSPYRFDFLVATCLGFLGTLGAMALSDLALSPARRGRATTAFVPGPIKRVRLSVVAGVAAAGALLTVVYIATLPQIPVLQLLKGGSARGDLDVARENALKLLPGPTKYLFNLTRGILLPFITVVALVEFRNRRNLRSFLVLALAGGSALLFASITLEKSVVGAVLVVSAFGWLLARGKPLSTGRLLLIGAAAMAFPMFVVVGTAGFKVSALVPSALALGRRLFYLPSEVLYHYFEFVPQVQPHLLGRTLPYVSKAMAGGNYPIENAVYRFAYARDIQSGSANAAYLGALWADFGWYGIAIGSMFTGFLLRALQELVDRLGRSGPAFALQAMLAYQVVNLTATSIPGLLDPLGWGFELPLTAGVLALGLYLKPRVLRRAPAVATP